MDFNNDDMLSKTTFNFSPMPKKRGGTKLNESPSSGGGAIMEEDDDDFDLTASNGHTDFHRNSSIKNKDKTESPYAKFLRKPTNVENSYKSKRD